MLRLEDLSCGYGSFHAVGELSLDVLQPGTITGLIGPNGAGKSSTLMCVAGHVELQAGRIHVRRPGHRRAAADRACAPRHRDRAGRPAAVQGPVGRGQSARRRPDTPDEPVQEGRRTRAVAVPASARTPRFARRQPVRRRAADAVDRARADGAAQVDHDRRTLARPDAEDGRPVLRRAAAPEAATA